MILKAELPPIHQTQVCTPPYSPPECGPLTPSYKNYNAPYNNNNNNNSSTNNHMLTGLGIFTQQEPPQNCTPITPPGPLEWNGQDSSYGFSTVQLPFRVHEQKWNDYSNCMNNASPYATTDSYSSYPHCTNSTTTSTTSSASDYGFSVSHMTAVGSSTDPNYDSGNYSSISAQTSLQSPYQSGPDLYLQNSLDMTPPNMQFIHTPSPTLPNVSSPMMSPILMDYQGSTIAVNEEAVCGSSSSSASRIAVVGRNSTGQRVRRQQRGRAGERAYRCEVSGCAKGFDRHFNYTKHQETHGYRPRNEKCSYEGCPYIERGFVRKHDLVRHINTASVSLPSCCL
jgi:hypothetical protein